MEYLDEYRIEQVVTYTQGIVGHTDVVLTLKSEPVDSYHKDIIIRAVRAAVQEAAQWGRKDENESHKASCKPVKLEDCFGSDPNITGGKTVDEFLRDQREETPNQNASNH